MTLRTELKMAPSRFLWPELDREQAGQLWDELIEWVTWLRSRYELEADIKACWYRHPPMVEELTALMASHKAAYLVATDEKTAKPIEFYRNDMSLWHRHELRPMLREWHDFSDTDSCDPDHCTHQPHRVTTLPGLGDFIAADVAERPARQPRRLTTSPASPEPAATLAGPTSTPDVVEPGALYAAIDAGDATELDDGVIEYGGVRYEWDSAVSAYTRVALDAINLDNHTPPDAPPRRPVHDTGDETPGPGVDEHAPHLEHEPPPDPHHGRPAPLGRSAFLPAIEMDALWKAGRVVEDAGEGPGPTRLRVDGDSLWVWDSSLNGWVRHFDDDTE